MAISCEPSDLAANATCFGCLTEKQNKMVALYLMREIAGLSALSPEELVQLASSLEPIVNVGKFEEVELYLLCAAVNA